MGKRSQHCPAQTTECFMPFSSKGTLLGPTTPADPSAAAPREPCLLLKLALTHLTSATRSLADDGAALEELSS